MVEIIPKPAEKAPLWQNILLYFSLLVLIGAVLAYFLLGYFIQENQKTSKEKGEALARLKTSEKQAAENKVTEYQKKIEDFANLINQHKVSSDFFAFLEGTIHPQVWLSKLDLNVQKAEVKISGETEKTALGQQLSIFKENKKILKTDLSDLQIKEGEKVSFTILLSLDSEIFKFLKPR